MTRSSGRHDPKVVVIGAGVGGLATAAVLARAGLDVTVLEAHIYPGGSAGTFFHNGFHFDAGATLAAGFYPGGPMDLLARAAKITAWQGTAADVIMRVHLPEAQPITRYAGTERHLERSRSFTPTDQRFWAWQERTAELVWNLAAQIPPWPPLDWDQALTLTRLGVQALRASAPQDGLISLLLDAARPLAHRTHGSSETLRLFLDAQLLISAQTDSNSANALYAAAALDLPRRGAAHLAGGMGSLAQALVTSIRSHGGEVHFRRKVKAIEFKNSQPVGVRLTRGGAIPADVVVANLTPWSLSALLPSRIRGHFRRLRTPQESGWGAFTVYAGVPAGVIPLDSPLHHQVVLGRPLGEGNSVFISASPPWDATRAPDGLQALTLSTHTRLGPWWQLFRHDRDAYEGRKKRMGQALLAAADRAFPALSETAAPVLPGTPITFERFTQRALGWVGGFPQTRALRGLNPHIRPGMWLVGDSIFPGQSTAAVALGGLRVADGVLHSLGMPALDTFLQAPDTGDARLRTPGIQADPTSGRTRRAHEQAPQTELTNRQMKPNHEEPGGMPARLQHREAAPC